MPSIQNMTPQEVKDYVDQMRRINVSGGAGSGVCFPNAGMNQAITTTGISTSGVMTYPTSQAVWSTYDMAGAAQQASTVRQSMFFVTQIGNGYIVGMQSQMTEDSKFCKDMKEISEAIVAMMALNKLTKE